MRHLRIRRPDVSGALFRFVSLKSVANSCHQTTEALLSLTFACLVRANCCSDSALGGGVAVPTAIHGAGRGSTPQLWRNAPDPPNNLLLAGGPLGRGRWGLCLLCPTSGVSHSSLGWPDGQIVKCGEQ